MDYISIKSKTNIKYDLITEFNIPIEDAKLHFNHISTIINYIGIDIHRLERELHNCSMTNK